MEQAATFTVSDRLSITADTIHALGRKDGFAGQVIDLENRSVTVHWKGDPPQEVKDYRTYAKTLGITVMLESGAALARDEALTAAERITSDPSLVARAGLLSVSYRAANGGRIVARVSEKGRDQNTPRRQRLQYSLRCLVRILGKVAEREPLRSRSGGHRRQWHHDCFRGCHRGKAEHRFHEH